MNVTAVQEERGPRRQKLVKRKMSAKKSKSKNFLITNPDKVEHFSPAPQQIPTIAVASKTPPANVHQEMLIQILLTCLKQAQHSECFRAVTEYQRNVILRSVWSELFVLKASHWPIDIAAAVESCGDRHLLDIISATKTLSADLMELSLLEILILSRPEYAVDAKERSKLQFNLENAVSRLEVYVSQQMLSERGGSQSHHYHQHQHLSMEATRTQSVMRFAKLLLGLRHLSLHLYESSLNNLFRNIAEENFRLPAEK